MADKVTIKKFGGDDYASWALFVNGRVKMTGLTKTEAQYYKRKWIETHKEK
jgi:hypothetical protein